MSTTTIFQDASAVGEFLTTLFGLKTEAVDSETIPADSVYAIALYADDNGDIKACIACDLDCAAKLGAALTQIAIGAVEDAISAGELPDNLKANLSEIFNILVNLFTNQQTERLVLSSFAFGDEATTHLQKSPRNSSGFDLDIQRYGVGNMDVFVAE